MGYELQGQASLDLAHEGVCYEITAPLQGLVEPTATLDRACALPLPAGSAHTRGEMP